MKLRMSWMIGLTLVAGGCDYSKYESGLPIARETLRDVQPLDLPAASTTMPTTVPVATTVPTTRKLEELLAVPPAEVRVGIDECRRLALENNLDLKVDLYNPVIAAESLNEERARFESLFTASTNYGVSDAPVSSKLEGSNSKSLQTNVGVTVPLRTGGSLQFNLPVNRFETDNSFSTLNPAYTSDFSASMSIPLLRGAGLAYNALPIRIANYQYQSSQAQTKLEIIRVLTDVDRIYWRLYAARQELEVRKKEYDLATAQLDRARRQVEAGTAAEVEIVRAESGVADNLENIITSETNVRKAQRDLKRIIHRDDLDLATPTVVIPITTPNAVRYLLDTKKILHAAMTNRMELLEDELNIATQAANIQLARNDLLPLVTLDYTYGVNGLGGNVSDAFTLLRSKRFEDHRVGLAVQVPIGNEAAKSRLRRSLAQRLAALATKEARELMIQKEVLDALDTLEANWQRIIAAQRRVILAARVVDLETRQFQQGLRTSTEVLDAQAKLADAQSSEIAAVTDYQISQVDIAFATGNSLGAAAVSWRLPQTGQIRQSAD